MTLKDAEKGKIYTIKEINTKDADLNLFLSSLGCSNGARIMVIANRKKKMVLQIRDSSYSIDEEIARAIVV